jgi:hypothetical protein
MLQDQAIAENFFDLASYDQMWTWRYFCPFDTNHYLFEIVKEKDGSVHPVAIDMVNKKSITHTKEQFMAAYGEFIFYSAMHYDPTWKV